MDNDNQTTEEKLEEAQATALAAFSLSVNTLRFLQKEGALDQAAVNAILTGVLSVLEQGDLVSERAVHSARVLLSGVANDLGVPLSKSN